MTVRLWAIRKRGNGVVRERIDVIHAGQDHRNLRRSIIIGGIFSDRSAGVPQLREVSVDAVSSASPTGRTAYDRIDLERPLTSSRSPPP